MPFNFEIKSDSTALFRCCDEIQFVYMCVKCYETMDCQFCSDWEMDKPHGCQ